uniref:Uncharacterized protein n=1 Tax=Peronospora matthiolae TaxID=2874970 RepID=A0AAV1UH35_9STRA
MYFGESEKGVRQLFGTSLKYRTQVCSEDLAVCLQLLLACSSSTCRVIVSLTFDELIPSLASDRLLETMEAAVVEESTPECFPPS